HVGFAVPESDRGGERRARPLAGLERTRNIRLEPEHLGAGRHAKSQARHHRRHMERGTAGRAGYHVAMAIDDVEMGGIAGRGCPTLRLNWSWVVEVERLRCSDRGGAFGPYDDLRLVAMDTSGTQLEGCHGADQLAPRGVVRPAQKL